MTTYFVATTGNNQGSGSASSPWRTISHAMTMPLKPGDEIVVRPGTYNESVSITRSGSEGNHVTLRSEVPGEALIRPSAGAWNAVNVYANHVTIDGFDISGTGGGDGIEANGVHHIDILNNTVHGNGESGIQFNWADFIRVEGNETYGNASTGWFSGISIYQNRNITGDSNTDGYRTIVRNNVSYDNVTDRGAHTDGNGIIIDDFQSTQTSGHPNYTFATLVENNLVYSNGGKGIAVHWSDQVTVRNNTAWHNNLDLKNPGTWRGEFSNQDSNNNNWVNNIAVADPTVNPNNTAIGFYGNNDNVVWANNITFNGRPGDASLKLDGGNPAPSTANGNLLGVNPQFVGAPRDFRLRDDSPAVDAGTSAFGVAQEDLDGAARVVGRIDLGVYEAGTAAGPNSAPVAADDAGFTTRSGSSITISADALLANDRDPDGDILQLSSVSSLKGGSARLNSAGDVVFTPHAGYSGDAGFVYTVSDGHGGSAAAEVSLTVQVPADTSSLWDDSAAPAQATVSDSLGVELGLKFRADVDGEITAIRFYRGPENTGSQPVSFWSADGTLLGSGRAVAGGSGWQEVVLDRPVAISSGDISIASYHAPGGRYSVSENYFSQEVASGPLTALKDGGVYAYGRSGLFPELTYRSTNYWVDVVFNPTEASHEGSARSEFMGGTSAGDVMLGADGNDDMRGYGGNDVLRGQNGSDKLIGGWGSDILIGGTGSDTFRFMNFDHSRPNDGIDQIRAGDGAGAVQGVGRAGGDVIDVSALDADWTRSGHQSFAFQETGKGGLWLSDRNGSTVVYANNDDDAMPEFELVIHDGQISAGSYIAEDFLL